MIFPSLKFELQAKGLQITGLARDLGVDKGTVSRWNRRVPAERVLDVERVTGISRCVLRPDLYPDERHMRPEPTRAAE